MNDRSSQAPAENGGVWCIEGEELIRLAPSAGETAAVLVPSEDVLLLAVDLPLPSRRARASALPFALEDHVAAPLGEVHFALGTELSAQRHLAGAVRHDIMTRWVERLEAAGLSYASLVPDAVALPVPAPGGWSVQLAEGRALVRTEDGAGFATAFDRLPQLWSAAGRPLCTSYGSPLPPEIPSVPAELELEPITARILVPAIDLRQGLYARPRRAMPPVARKIAYILAAGALAHGAIAVADTLALRGIAEDRRSDAQLLAERFLPGTVVNRDFAAEVNQLLTAGGSRSSSFIPYLNQIAASLGQAGPGIVLRGLHYDAPSARLTMIVQAPDMATLQRVEPVLTARGLEPVVEAIPGGTGANVARIVIGGPARSSRP